jgi:hypothetical protein
MVKLEQIHPLLQPFTALVGDGASTAMYSHLSQAFSKPSRTRNNGRVTNDDASSKPNPSQNQQNNGSDSIAAPGPGLPQIPTHDADPLDTPRARLAAAVLGPKKSKRLKRRAPDTEDVKEVQLLAEQQTTHRRLDRAMRWNAFLHFTNDLWIDVIYEVYGSDIDIDSPEVVEARSKIFNNTKAWKWRVLKRMEVCPYCTSIAVMDLCTLTSYGEAICRGRSTLRRAPLGPRM